MIAAQDVPTWVLLVSPIATLVAALGGAYVGGSLQLSRERERWKQDRDERRSDRREQDLRDIQTSVGPVLSAAAPLLDFRVANPLEPVPTQLENAIMETTFPVLVGATRVWDDELLAKAEELGSLAATLTDPSPSEAELRAAVRDLGTCAGDLVRRTGELVRSRFHS